MSSFTGGLSPSMIAFFLLVWFLLAVSCSMWASLFPIRIKPAFPAVEAQTARKSLFQFYFIFYLLILGCVKSQLQHAGTFVVVCGLLCNWGTKLSCPTWHTESQFPKPRYPTHISHIARDSIKSSLRLEVILFSSKENTYVYFKAGVPTQDYV